MDINIRALGDGQINVNGTIYLVVIDKQFRDGRVKMGNDVMIGGFIKFITEHSDKFIGPNGIKTNSLESECNKIYQLTSDDKETTDWKYEFIFLSEDNVPVWGVTVDGEGVLFHVLELPKLGNFEYYRNGTTIN